MTNPTRSRAATQYRPLYRTAEWKRLRAVQLAKQPYCQCLCHKAHGDNVPATVADHNKPHKGSRALFFDPKNLKSLCHRCHCSCKQRVEHGKGIGGCTVDGAPLEPQDDWPVYD